MKQYVINTSVSARSLFLSHFKPIVSVRQYVVPAERNCSPLLDDDNNNTLMTKESNIQAIFKL
jgi:hypothetical protein